MNRLIVDGFNLAFRAHFAFQNLMTSTGLLSGGLYGFLTTLRSVKTKYSNFEIVVAWDSYAKRKKELYPEYKATRNHFNIDSPIQDLKAALSCLDVIQAEAPGEEADDVIASMAQNIEGLVYIYSSDKDLLQLVRDGKIIQIRPKVGATAERIYDEEAVFKEFGVKPQDFACYLAFRGDTSDNVPGVARVPSKILSSLSSEYHHPTEVYKNLTAETLTPFQRSSIENFQSQIGINYELVKLNDQLECIVSYGSSNKEEFDKILKKYEIKSILSNSYVDVFDKNTSFLNRIDSGHQTVKTFSIFEE